MSIQQLPQEILLSIFDYLDARDLSCCAKVSKIFRKVSLDDKLWLNIYINFPSVALAKFIGFTINNGCRSLEVYKSIDHQNVENPSFPQENGLKHLKLHHNLYQRSCKQDLFINLIQSCHALEKLSIQGVFFMLPKSHSNIKNYI